MSFTRKKAISFLFLFIVTFQILFPSVSLALTSGPTQPEVQNFQQMGVNDMVDLATGDFTYNIPIFELPGPNGGYPFNLSYGAGIKMDQEASWVGLGWNLQPGSINRQIRGLPDEFNGDKVKTKMSIDKNVTVGIGVGTTLKIFGGDINGTSKKRKGILGIGLKVYHNTYRGFGYTIDNSINLAGSTKSGMTGGLSLGLSLDPKEGVGISPSLSLEGKTGSMGIGAGYNSKQGLNDLSFGGSLNVTVLESAKLAKKNKRPEGERELRSRSISSSSSISLAHPGYTPQVSMPMNNTNLSLDIAPGANWWGLSALGYIRGFYNEQSLVNDKKFVDAKAFGYLNHQFSDNPKDLSDFNREKDGMVSLETPNLALPNLTYDVYSVTGQGIGMMYRPMRNDFGVPKEQEVSSTSNAVGIGLDFAPAATRVGVNISLSHSKSTSGVWSDDNDVNNSPATSDYFKSELNKVGEPVYFKVHGEPTSDAYTKVDAIGGEKAVRIQLQDVKENPVAKAKLENANKKYNLPNYNNSQSRIPRNQVISPITNGELVSSTGEVILPEYKIKYRDSLGIEQTFNRTSPVEKHLIAGYTALSTEGMRYVYGMPAYNLFQEDAIFSVLPKTDAINLVDVSSGADGDPKYNYDGTDKFLKRTQLPKYAHAYLLTSILGPDYVDVTNDGVTSDDLGYWVKFTYQQTTKNYKWRDPYSKAHLNMGWRSDPRDDKGSYVFGVKELWYLAKAETKSHVAEFKISARHDGRDVSSRLQDSDTPGLEKVSKLDTIKLYSRLAGPNKPIKVVRFEYDYSLCKSVYNNDKSLEVGNENKGKLTLKKLWFEYGGSSRGSLNPYTFAYSSNNPVYDVLAFDRWGTYKPSPVGKKYYNNDFPYAEQDPLKKMDIDANASAWSLTEIRLPSGGSIKIDYETDDYAYVQNKTAMQMVQMLDPVNTVPQESFLLSGSNMAVRFKLEKTIPGLMTTEQQKAEVLKYIDTKTWQLYFKIFVNLRSPSEVGFSEYVSGYVNIDKSKLNLFQLEKNAQDQYAYGKFYVVKEKNANPFSLRAWQHLRTNQPDLANTGKKMSAAGSNKDKIEKIKAMGSIGTQIAQMFKGFNDYCNDKNWGKKVDATRSWIRLNSPDKIKYGGGLRVKQITMRDNWASDSEGVYGQVYKYTIAENEKSNVQISSGVAAYEPLSGGEENALHYGKKWTQSIPMRSDNNLFFEYPINEANYPGPEVVYSSVSVYSLPAAALTGEIPLTNVDIFPGDTNATFGTTGKTVHEFYTAKDFPVITDETNKVDRQFKLNLPIPFLGTISVAKLTSSQGYSIVTNDMHGKEKAVYSYRQSSQGGFEKDPISWVKYHYKEEWKTVNGERVRALNNVMKINRDGDLVIPRTTDLPKIDSLYTLAQEMDFTYDMRQYEDKAWEGGIDTGVDILYFFIANVPVKIPWPNLGKSTTRLRIASTNKVIFKAGILQRVEAFDGGSKVMTNNLKWDKQTGAIVLSTVNNNYDDLVYNYTRSAYREYHGMGAAYQNIGLSFNVNSVQLLPYKTNDYKFSHSLADNLLQPGDEFLLYPVAESLLTPVAKVVYTGEPDGEPILYSEKSLSGQYIGKITRSGYRNQLGASSETITALKDPSNRGTSVTYSKTVQVPK